MVSSCLKTAFGREAVYTYILCLGDAGQCSTPSGGGRVRERHGAEMAGTGNPMEVRALSIEGTGCPRPGTAVELPSDKGGRSPGLRAKG